MMRLVLIALAALAIPASAQNRLSEQTHQSLRAAADQIAAIVPGRVPELLVKAIMAAEQPDHLERAPAKSSLTQQLARMHLGAMPTLEQKSAEAALATYIGERMTPRDIVRTYAATVYFGRNCFGFADASSGLARKWYSEAEAEIWLALAALPRAPSWYLRDRTALATRVDDIFSEMLDAGLIEEREAQRLERLPIANLHAGKGCSRQLFLNGFTK